MIQIVNKTKYYKNWYLGKNSIKKRKAHSLNVKTVSYCLKIINQYHNALSKEKKTSCPDDPVRWNLGRLLMAL